MKRETLCPVYFFRWQQPDVNRSHQLRQRTLQDKGNDQQTSFVVRNCSVVIFYLIQCLPLSLFWWLRWTSPFCLIVFYVCGWRHSAPKAEDSQQSRHATLHSQVKQPHHFKIMLGLNKITPSHTLRSLSSSD